MVENGKILGFMIRAAVAIILFGLSWRRWLRSKRRKQKPNVFTPENTNGPYTGAGGLLAFIHEKTGEQTPVFCIPGGAGCPVGGVLIPARVNVPGIGKAPGKDPRGGGVHMKIITAARSPAYNPKIPAHAATIWPGV